MIRTAAFVLAATVAFLAQSATATADPYKDRPTRVVEIADLDLADPADQQEMVRRVEHAAKRMCRDEPTRIARRACARATIKYTLNIVQPEVRRAYLDGRPQNFALARN